MQDCDGGPLSPARDTRRFCSRIVKSEAWSGSARPSRSLLIVPRLAGRVRTRKAVVGCYEDAERIMVRSVIPVLTPHELKELHEYRKRRRAR